MELHPQKLYGGFLSHGDTPIAAWFKMENPILFHVYSV